MKKNSIIELKNQSIPYSLCRRTNQKYIRVRVTTEGKLKVSAPVHIHETRIEQFLKSRSAWILRNLEKQNSILSEFDTDSKVLYFGKIYRVVRANDQVRVDKTRSILCVPESTCKPEAKRDVIKNWFVSQAKSHLPERVEFIAERIGAEFKRVSVRNQRTRWGSSSSKGTISLNWRLIMMPQYVQDYIIVHELVHQTVSNHSRVFWDKVSRIVPDYKSAEKWIAESSFIMGVLR
jgi:hypothetical protein